MKEFIISDMDMFIKMLKVDLITFIKEDKKGNKDLIEKVNLCNEHYHITNFLKEHFKWDKVKLAKLSLSINRIDSEFERIKELEEEKFALINFLLKKNINEDLIEMIIEKDDSIKMKRTSLKLLNKKIITALKNEKWSSFYEKSEKNIVKRIIFTKM